MTSTEKKQKEQLRTTTPGDHILVDQKCKATWALYAPEGSTVHQWNSHIRTSSTGTLTAYKVYMKCKASIVMNESNTKTIPEIGSYSLSRRDTIVDFPVPLEPTRAITEPAGMERLKSLKIDVSGRVGYANSTSLNSKAPLNVSLPNVTPSI